MKKFWILGQHSIKTLALKVWVRQIQLKVPIDKFQSTP